ncbi:MAG: ABC transporter ATP-binding protein/permease [Treponema sp.]|jgi:ATP-binding cassette subfamily B protein/ATP-binding cassette subfamily C protein|nr:ABC transporter ATP-binding protein/permease [Treponema sp.]
MKNKVGKHWFIGLSYMVKVYWKYHKPTLFYQVIVCVLEGVLPFAGIVFPKYIIDELTGAHDISRIVFFVTVLLLCSLFGNTFIGFVQARREMGQARIYNGWVMDLIRRLYEADLERLEASSFLDLQSRAYKFLEADGYGFGAVLGKTADIAGRIITLVGIISIISLLNPLVVLVFIGLVIITTLFNSQNKKVSVELQMGLPPVQRRSSYYSNLFSNNLYAKELRINDMGAWGLKKVNEYVGLFYDFTKKWWANNLKAQMFGNGVAFIQQGVAYAYLVYGVINGQFGIGSFTMYLAAINAFSGSMNAVMNNIIDIRRYSDYYDAVDEFMNMPKRQREGKQALTLATAPALEFRDVSFRYPGQEAFTLKHINIVIPAGQKLSVVGENGAGKTTFTKLLMRLYRPTEGVILLNGVDIQEYDFDDYERNFSVVFQDFVLFAASLRENVTAGHDVDDAKAIDALRRSGFSDKLDRLEKGLDTPIYKILDESGFEPSGGEGQKIVMARALLKDAPVVILDEPTAALDPRAEYEIYMHFNNMVAGKTAVFISHRLSSAQFCDKIAVFKNGEIVEHGSHTELVSRGGLYHELFSMQAQFYGEQDAEKH